MQSYGFAHLKDDGSSAQYLHQQLDRCTVPKPAIFALHTADVAAVQYLHLAQCHTTGTQTRNVLRLQLCLHVFPVQE